MPARLDDDAGCLACSRSGVSGFPAFPAQACLRGCLRAAAAPQTRQPVAAAPDVGRQQGDKENDERDITVMDNGGQRLREADDELGGKI